VISKAAPKSWSSDLGRVEKTARSASGPITWRRGAGRTSSSVGEEKRHNLRLTKPKPEFVELMANLGLPYPKKIGEPPPLPAVHDRCKACHSYLCD